MIFDKINLKWKLIIWETWSGKTSSLLYLISNYDNLYYLSNTKTVIWANNNISYICWTHVISIRKNALNYYNEMIKNFIYTWKIYENSEWIYTNIEDKILLNYSSNLSWIFNIKISKQNRFQEIINIEEKLFIIISNISHSNIPVIFNINYSFFLNFLWNLRKNLEIIKEIVNNIPIYNIEWDIYFITKKIYEL